MKRLEAIRRALGRVTSSGRFIPVVDGLRFVAIVSVVLYHLNGYVLKKSPAISVVSAEQSWLQAVLDTGHVGVNLFFVISGFILGLPFAERYLLGRPGPRLRQYYKRRVLRIEPPYIINLLLIFGLLVTVKGLSAQSLLPHLGASLFYVHNLVFGEGSRINFVAWSLEVEVQFYILAPLLAVVFAVRKTGLRRGILFGMVVLSVALKAVFPEVTRQYTGATVVYCLDHFLIGFLLVDLYVASWNHRPRLQARWDLIAVVAWCGVFAVNMHPRTRPLVPLMILPAYVAAFRGPVSTRIFSQPWLVTIGGMCYTIYLYHFFVISAVGRWTIGISVGPYYWTNMLFQALLVVPAVLAVCALLFLAFEKPFMRRDWHVRIPGALLAIAKCRLRPNQ